jgi:hypothetical protein
MDAVCAAKTAPGVSGLRRKAAQLGYELVPKTGAAQPT